MSIPIFYTPRQIFGEEEGLEFGAYKAKLVHSLLGSSEVHSPLYPTCASDLYPVHDRRYVDDVFSGKIVNGFRTKNKEHLVAIRYAVANYMAATKMAIEESPHISMSLTSGFHHAGYDFGGGYCTFNALMLAAARYAGEDMPVLILDGDAHFGDGCIDILNKLQLKHIHYSQNISESVDRIQDSEFKLVLYQAGADALMEDTYGAGTLSIKEFKERDRLIFQACKDTKTPIVFNLAGGYGAPNRTDTAFAHFSTYVEAMKIYFHDQVIL